MIYWFEGEFLTNKLFPSTIFTAASSNQDDQDITKVFSNFRLGLILYLSIYLSSSPSLSLSLSLSLFFSLFFSLSLSLFSPLSTFSQVDHPTVIVIDSHFVFLDPGSVQRVGGRPQL